uniref:Uncharacterized protein n=1 Tax=Triticum urartu TaxID=4572 RepID=A0A8R7Q8T0_TRIUA
MVVFELRVTVLRHVQVDQEEVDDVVLVDAQHRERRQVLRQAQRAVALACPDVPHVVHRAFLPTAEVRRQRPDGQRYLVAGPIAVAIHGDELDAAADAGHAAELLRLKWRFPFVHLAAVIRRALSGQRNEAEPWVGAVPEQPAHIADGHAFEQIHPADAGASIREARVCPEEVAGTGQLVGEARDLQDPFRGGRVGVYYRGQLDKDVAAFLEAQDGGSHTDVGTVVVKGGRGDRREGVVAGVVDQIASFRVGRGAVRIGEEGDQVLVRAGDVGGCDISVAYPRPQYAEGGQLRRIGEAGVRFQGPQVGEDGVSSVLLA